MNKKEEERFDQTRHLSALIYGNKLKPEELAMAKEFYNKALYLWQIECLKNDKDWWWQLTQGVF